MPFELDPDLSAAIAARAAMARDFQPPARGDWKTLRAVFEASQAMMIDGLPPVAGVSTLDVEAVSADGAAVAMRWFTRDGSRPGSAAVYLHGGGMILGSVDLYSHVIADYVAATGVPML